MESRRLLAATIVNGVLVGTGTSGADVISMRRVLTDDVVLTINGAAQTFDMDDFTGVRLSGLGGNDTFRMIDALVSPKVRNTTVIGGDGDDAISYETRTAPLKFSGYVQPDITVTPYVEVASGVQTDRVMSDVERFIGGSGGDNFGINNRAEVDEDLYPLPDLVLEGRGGNDSFGNPYQLAAVIHGGAGDDFYFADDGDLGDTFFGGDGDDRVRIENFGRPSLLDGGTGTDTVDVNFFVLLGGVLDMGTFPGVENLVNVSDPMEIIGNGLSNFIDASNSDGVVTIRGLGGNDTLIGGDRADLLQGGDGNDSLLGNDGDDTLDGGPGTDTLVGGAGNDTLLNGESTGGDPSIVISGGVLVAHGTGGNDTFTIRRHLFDNVIVTVNALSSEVDMDDFTGVRFMGFGGNDVFRMVDALVSPVVRDVTVLGGDGDDTMDYSSRTAGLRFHVDPTAPDARGVQFGLQDDEFDEVETLIGGAGDDAFTYGQEGQATPGVTSSFRLEGRGGNDTFQDFVWPTGDAYGNVSMFGGDGNDSFADESDQRFTREFFFGEAGNDRATHYENGGSFNGGAGIDTMHFEHYESAGWNLGSFPGFENATASSQGNSEATISLTGTAGANDLKVTSGKARIFGLAGNDALTGNSEADSLSGGDGNDTLLGGEGDDELSGDGGNDWLAGQDGNDTLDGGIGTDTLDGGAGSNTNINGEVLVGQQVAIGIVNRVLNVIGTGAGETISLERTGTDNVIARAGGVAREFDMDDFDGVSVLGLGGNDVITIKQALVAGSLVRKVTIDGGGGNDSITGAAGDDVLRGNTGIDTLLGLGGRDALFGGAGNDRLVGGLGQDFLDGGDNDDFIDAREGAAGDTVQGGNGSDTAELDAGDSSVNVENFA